MWSTWLAEVFFIEPCVTQGHAYFVVQLTDLINLFLLTFSPQEGWMKVFVAVLICSLINNLSGESDIVIFGF